MELVGQVNKATAKTMLEKLIASYQELDESFNRLNDLCGMTHDSPFGLMVFKLFDNHLEDLAQFIGDKFGYIKWFIETNECGRNALWIGDEGKRVQVRTIDDLLTALGVE